MLSTKINIISSENSNQIVKNVQKEPIIPPNDKTDSILHLVGKPPAYKPSISGIAGSRSNSITSTDNNLAYRTPGTPQDDSRKASLALPLQIQNPKPDRKFSLLSSLQHNQILSKKDENDAIITQELENLQKSYQEDGGITSSQNEDVNSEKTSVDDNLAPKLSPAKPTQTQQTEPTIRSSSLLKASNEPLLDKEKNDMSDKLSIFHYDAHADENPDLQETLGKYQKTKKDIINSNPDLLTNIPKDMSKDRKSKGVFYEILLKECCMASKDANELRDHSLAIKSLLVLRTLAPQIPAFERALHMLHDIFEKSIFGDVKTIAKIESSFIDSLKKLDDNPKSNQNLNLSYFSVSTNPEPNKQQTTKQQKIDQKIEKFFKNDPKNFLTIFTKKPFFQDAVDKQKKDSMSDFLVKAAETSMKMNEFQEEINSLRKKNRELEMNVQTLERSLKDKQKETDRIEQSSKEKMKALELSLRERTIEIEKLENRIAFQKKQNESLTNFKSIFETTNRRYLVDKNAYKQQPVKLFDNSNNLEILKSLSRSFAFLENNFLNFMEFEMKQTNAEGPFYFFKDGANSSSSSNSISTTEVNRKLNFGNPNANGVSSAEMTILVYEMRKLNETIRQVTLANNMSERTGMDPALNEMLLRALNGGKDPKPDMTGRGSITVETFLPPSSIYTARGGSPRRNSGSVESPRPPARKGSPGPFETGAPGLSLDLNKLQTQPSNSNLTPNSENLQNPFLQLSGMLKNEQLYFPLNNVATSSFNSILEMYVMEDLSKEFRLLHRATITPNFSPTIIHLHGKRIQQIKIIHSQFNTPQIHPNAKLATIGKEGTSSGVPNEDQKLLPIGNSDITTEQSKKMKKWSSILKFSEYDECDGLWIEQSEPSNLNLNTTRTVSSGQTQIEKMKKDEIEASNSNSIPRRYYWRLFFEKYNRVPVPVQDGFSTTRTSIVGLPKTREKELVYVFEAIIPMLEDFRAIGISTIRDIIFEVYLRIVSIRKNTPEHFYDFNSQQFNLNAIPSAIEIFHDVLELKFNFNSKSTIHNSSNSGIGNNNQNSVSSSVPLSFPIINPFTNLISASNSENSGSSDMLPANSEELRFPNSAASVPEYAMKFEFEVLMSMEKFRKRLFDINFFVKILEGNEDPAKGTSISIIGRLISQLFVSTVGNVSEEISDQIFTQFLTTCFGAKDFRTVLDLFNSSNSDNVSESVSSNSKKPKLTFLELIRFFSDGIKSETDFFIRSGSDEMINMFSYDRIGAESWVAFCAKQFPKGMQKTEFRKRYFDCWDNYALSSLVSSRQIIGVASEKLLPVKTLSCLYAEFKWLEIFAKFSVNTK